MTLDRYFNTYETQTPDFVARIWLGNTYAGGNEFRGYTTDIYETNIPMNYVLSETAAGGSGACSSSLTPTRRTNTGGLPDTVPAGCRLPS